jgi:hypothetical protein
MFVCSLILCHTFSFFHMNDPTDISCLSQAPHFKTFKVFLIYVIHFFSLWPCSPARTIGFSLLRFLDHTQRRITVDRAPPDEWSAHRRVLCLTTQNAQKRQTSMPPPTVFKLTIWAIGSRLRRRGHQDRHFVRCSMYV